MKAFLIAMIALVVITYGANWILMHNDFSAGGTTVSKGNVRID